MCISSCTDCDLPIRVHGAVIAAAAITLLAVLIIGVLGRGKVIPMGTSAGWGLSITAALLMAGGALSVQANLLSCKNC